MATNPDIRPRRFMKKPITIEAMRWDGNAPSQRAIVNWSGGVVSGWFDSRYFLEVRTLEGTLRVEAGDWVIKGIQGEFYPCRADIFEETYDEAF